MAVPELMRILLDEAHLGWDQAWDLTQRTLAYTNHTLLPEALEKWPLAWFEMMLPRHLEIIFEINRRLLDDSADALPRRRRPRPAREPDRGRPEQASAHGQSGDRRLAQHQRRGRHSLQTAAHHYGQGLGRDVSGTFQQQDQRRHTPPLAAAGESRRSLGRSPRPSATAGSPISSQLSKLKPLADDKSFRDAFRKAKREAKVQFADWLKRTCGETVDPDTIFDCQVKRIHEYKRQLLNALRIVVLYNRLRENPNIEMTPRTFFFAGKAAPAYQLAKLIIKFINNLAGTIDGDPAVRGRLKVVFLPDYCVSLAERLIPATRRVEPDLHCRLRSQRHEQHEVHDERGADHRHARRRHHRDGGGSAARKISSCSA